MRLIQRIVTALLLTLLIPVTALGANVQYFYDGAWHDYQGNIFKLEVNGTQLNPVMPPIVFSNYSVVPARAVFQDGLGATVEWHPDSREVTVAMGETELILTIDKTEACLNGRTVSMPIAPKIINDYTMIPARFVGENLGMMVDFDSATDTVIIDNREPAVTVTDVKLTEKSETEAVITITTDSPEPVYSEFILGDPLRLVLDVANGVFEETPQVIEAGLGNLQKIRFGQQSDSARIVIDLSQDLGYAARREGSSILVSVTVNPDAEQLPEENITDVFELITYGYEGGRDYIRFDLEIGEPVMKGNQVTVPVYGALPQESAVQAVTGFFGSKMLYTPGEEPETGTITVMLKNQEADMYLMENELRLTSVHKALPRSVMLDAGHGGADGGAVSYYEDGSIKALEKEFNLDVALRAQALLEAQGVEVHMIRTEDVYVDYLRVGSIANDAGTSLFVSIHTNSAIAEQANGIETFGYLEAGSVSNGMTSERLSELLLEALIDQTGAHERGVKDGKSLAVINSTKMPASLIEIGFISNPEECAKMMTEEYRQKLAQAVCDGVLQAFEEMGI